jgi:predicted acylesterase/phospholipase RssA
VSGASILNGLLAQAGDVRAMRVSDIDEVAVTLLRTVTRRGLLLSSWITPAYLGVIAVGAVGVVVAAVTSWPMTLVWWQIILAALVLGVVLMMRGTVIVHLMSRQFFRSEDGPTRLGQIASPVRHVFCATDLNSATAAEFAAGGGEPTFVTAMGNVSVPRFRLDRVVRASAAFPGLIPPARLSLRRLGLPWQHAVQRVPGPLRSMAGLRRPHPGRALHLADGGVSNNLATAEPRSGGDGTHLVLVVDASAPLETARLWRLGIPYLGEVGSLQRSMAVLYANTVEPRITELETRGALILARGPAGERVGDFPVVVRVTDNTSDGVLRIKRMRQRAGLPGFDDDEQQLLNLTRSYWNRAGRYLRDRYALKVMAARSSDVPTTFGTLDRAGVIGLLLHGYLGTMLALANGVMAPHGPIEIDRFERLLDLQTGDQPGFHPRRPDML